MQPITGVTLPLGSDRGEAAGPSGPNPHRRGNAPAYVHRTGTCHAPLWATECLDCDRTLQWRTLLSAALADLSWHQEMHRVWRAELRVRRGAA